MKKTLLMVSLIALGACTTTHRMDINDLRWMQADCSNKQAQISFLETQMTTPMDRLASISNMTGVFGILSMKSDGSYEQHKAIANREYDSVAKRLIWELRTNCP